MEIAMSKHFGEQAGATRKERATFAKTSLVDHAAAYSIRRGDVYQITVMSGMEKEWYVCVW